MKRVILLILLMALIVPGCAGQTDTETVQKSEEEAEKEDADQEDTDQEDTDQEDAQEVSAIAAKVLDAIFTGPNPELCNMEAAMEAGEAIGLGTENAEKTQEEQEAEEAAEKELDRIEENWRELVGDDIAEEYFDNFMNTWATMFLMQAEQYDQPMEIDSMELEEKGDITELVRVGYSIGEEEEWASVLFYYDSEGKIRDMEMKEASTSQPES